MRGSLVLATMAPSSVLSLAHKGVSMADGDGLYDAAVGGGALVVVVSIIPAICQNETFYLCH